MALVAAETKVAALEARLVIARDVYRAQKARIAELEAALNTRGSKPIVVPRAKAEVKTSYFVKQDGTTWQRRTLGTRSWVLPIEAIPIEV
jgi:hypothetical protein